MNNIVVILGVLVTVLTGLPVLFQLRANHPRGLVVLFFAEMWERFSYYGMRGILIFYLTQHFLFSDEFSSTQYGSYTSLVYLLPLIGGVLADRILGSRKAVAFGALLLVAGHLTMAYESRPATQTLTYQGHQYQMQLTGRGDDRQSRVIVDGVPRAFGSAANGGLTIKDLPPGASLPPVLPADSYRMDAERDPMGVDIFYLALSLIIMGVGFLKPNISTIVGQLYPQGDPRRDSGFTLYYYGVNLGAFWAAVLCGYLGQTVGWWAGFGLAGVGMLAGFIVFVLGKASLQGKGEPPDLAALKAKVVGPIDREGLIYILGLAGVGLVWLVVQRNALVGAGLIGSVVVSLAFITWFVIVKCDRIARERMLLALVLVFGAVVFFTLFEQAGSSLNLFADRNTVLDLTTTPVVFNLLGLDLVFATPAQLARAGMSAAGRLWIDTTMTAAQVQSFNAGYILIFAPIFAAGWAWLARRKLDPNPVVKFGLGLFQVGLGFMVLVWGAGMADAQARVPLMLVALLYLFHTTGELCLSPVGMSEITKLSVRSIVAFMMAVWFLASSIAQYVGGFIASLAGTHTVGGQVLDPALALQTSLHVFNLLGLWGMGIGGAFIVLSFFIRHWAHGVNDPESHVAPEPIAPTVDGERQAVSPAILRGELGERP